MSGQSDKEPANTSPKDLAVSPSVVTPEKLILLYEEDDWEQFALEWGEGFDPKYHHIDRLGSAGDKGRDVVGYAGEDHATCPIDVYQCKHYGHPLRPSDVMVELGKLCVFTHTKVYRVPRVYRFVAPKGVGTKLATLLEKPEELRKSLKAAWADSCESKISSKTTYPLTGDLLNHVESFDFGIVGYIPVHRILEQHSKTRYWHQRFKRDFPTRPQPSTAPASIQPNELRYVQQLIDAYAEHLDAAVPNPESLTDEELQEHFSRARTDFYMADSLNRFYRDQFPQGAFDHVLQQVHDGIIETVKAKHDNGYRRIVAVTQQAVLLPLAGSDYSPYVEAGDKKGLCHHLANEDKVRWVKT